jgi:chemotaxis protein methyltransferase CheR
MYRPVTQFQPFMLAAEYHRQKGNEQQAIRSLKRAAQIDPLSVLPWRLLANLYQRTKDAKAMENAITQTLLRDPQSHALHHQMAELWLRDGRPERAMPLLQTAVKLYPASGINHAQLAWVCQLTGNVMTAQNHASIAIQLDTLNPHVEQKLEHQVLIGLRGRRVDDARAMMQRLSKPPLPDSSFRAPVGIGRNEDREALLTQSQLSRYGVLPMAAVAIGGVAGLERFQRFGDGLRVDL